MLNINKILKSKRKEDNLLNLIKIDFSKRLYLNIYSILFKIKIIPVNKTKSHNKIIINKYNKIIKTVNSRGRFKIKTLDPSISSSFCHCPY